MKKVIHWLDENIEQYLCVILLAAFTTVLFIQVVMRKVFNNSLSWSEELARYMFIWLVFLGVSYGAKQMKHLRIDAFLGIFPKKVRPYVLILSEILVMVFSVIVVWSAYVTVSKYMQLGNLSAALHMPMWIVYSSAFLAYILVFIRQIQAIVVRVKALKNGEVE